MSLRNPCRGGSAPRAVRTHGWRCGDFLSLFQRTQRRFESCNARLLRWHQTRSGKHAQAIAPVRQRNAVVDGNQPEHAFEMGNLFVEVLIAHLTIRKLDVLTTRWRVTVKRA